MQFVNSCATMSLLLPRAMKKKHNGYGPVTGHSVDPRAKGLGVLCWSASAANRRGGWVVEPWSRPQGILKAGRERDGGGWCGGSASGATRNRVKAGARSTPYIKQSIETWGALQLQAAGAWSERTNPAVRPCPPIKTSSAYAPCRNRRSAAASGGSRF
jgi:hypothetical protein